MNLLVRRCLPNALLLLAVVLVAPGRAQTTTAFYAWKNVAIKGGGYVTGLVYHPTEQDLLYARTDVGGAYRWNATARRWMPLNDALTRDDSQLTGVLSVGLDPHDASRVYLACGQYTPSWASFAAVLVSTDQGTTWTKTKLPFKLGGNEDGRGTGERLQVDPHDGTVLLLGSTDAGLWKSTDRAATWSKIASFTPSAVSFVLFDSSSGKDGAATPNVYVGVGGASPGLWRSTDGGATWGTVPGQPTGLIPLQAKLAADGMLYVSFSDALGPNNATKGGIWRYDPSTPAWRDVTPPTGQGGFCGVAVDAQRPNVVLVSTLDRWSPRDELYYSSDRGVSWTAVFPRSTLDTTAAPYASSLTPHWITDVEIDPRNSGRAWFVTGYGVFATDALTTLDGLGSVAWDFRDDGLEETVPLGLASPSTGAPLVSVVGDFDGFRHTDVDTSPAAGRLKPSYGTSGSIDFAERDPSIMVRTTNTTPRALLSKDGGVTWSPFPTSPPTAGNGAGSIAVAANGRLFLWVPARSVPYYSADGGATWTASTGIPDPGNATYVPVADRWNSATFIVHDTTAGRLFFTTDGGVTFTAGVTGLPTGGDVIRSMPNMPIATWWLASPRGLLMIGDPRGYATTPGFRSAYRLGFGRGVESGSWPTIYVWGTDDNGATGIFRSESFGGRWTRITDDQHQFGWVNALAGDPNVFGRVYVGTGGRGIVYGDIAAGPPLLPTIDYAVFTTGASGSFRVSPTRAAPGAVFSATNLPTWAVFDSATGTITGKPTVPAGTLYQVTVRSLEPDTSASTETLNLFVAAPGSDLAVINLSARAQVGTGDNILIPGIVIDGAGSRNFLVRAVGPTLANYGVEGALADPKLTLLPQGSAVPLASNDNWEAQANPDAVRLAAAAKGGFPLLTGGKDAALLTPLAAGGYTAKIEGVTNGTGVALLEIYDVTDGGGTARLANLSVRAVAGSGSSVLIAGIVLNGGGARRVLVRGVGPTLENYGVSGALARPQLTLSRALPDGSSVPLATSGPWGANSNAADLRAAAKSVGAFALPEGSNDAAMLPLLIAGNYTLTLASQSSTGGAALIEVYLLPPDVPVSQ